jgi:hypothetical protein
MSVLFALAALAVLWLAVVGLVAVVGRHQDPVVEFMSAGWVVAAYRREHGAGGLR